MAIRKLKHHEKKLLKKVDFLNWSKKEDNTNRTLRVYQIKDRAEYYCYLDFCKELWGISKRLQELDPQDPFRIKTTTEILDKLYEMGLISTKKNLGECAGVIPDSFARRRLAVILVRLNFSTRLTHAVNLIEQGQIRIGSRVVTDPAFHVTRTFEDLINWTDDSNIRKTIDKYNEKLDDFDLLS